MAWRRFPVWQELYDESVKPQAGHNWKVKRIMKSKRALKIIGGLSKPSKMPGWAYGLPAKECKTGSKLVKVKNSVCEGCYALKGCYVFKVVQSGAIQTPKIY